MKTRRPQLVILSLLVAATISFACHRAPHRNIVRLDINHSPSHIAVGRAVHLTALQQYRETSGDPDAVSAAPATDNLHSEPVRARWSVSDSEVATISDDGTLNALKPGRVTIKSNWQGYEATQAVEVVANLPGESLPQLTVSNMQCEPHRVALSIAADGALRFQLGFDDDGCREIELTNKVPDHPLPWRFEAGGTMLELTEAHGPIVKGTVRRQDRSGEVSFTVWAEGDGAFPVSLSGKSVLLVGDSMAEGIGPYLQRKVEAAGGRFINGQERSSTIVWWQGSGKLRELLGQYHPDAVFIALGSNEIFLQQPELRAPLIKAMVGEIGRRPAYWIGPPSWKPDTGLVHIIEENFQAGHFYNSNDLKVPRASDGKHPTAEGYQHWTELVWNWYARAL